MATEEKREEPIPSGQAFFDNIFLLLGLSLVISTVLYNIWGLINVFLQTPAGP